MCIRHVFLNGSSAHTGVIIIILLLYDCTKEDKGQKRRKNRKPHTISFYFEFYVEIEKKRQTWIMLLPSCRTSLKWSDARKLRVTFFDPEDPARHLWPGISKTKG